jgi:hypothetical protein
MKKTEDILEKRLLPMNNSWSIEGIKIDDEQDEEHFPQNSGKVRACSKRIILLLVFLSVMLFSSFAQNLSEDILSLEGNWRVALDVFNTGTRAKWHEKGLPRSADLQLLEKVFFKGNIGEQPEEIYLPGTTNDGHLGQKLELRPGLTNGLEPLYMYNGKVWFEKEIIISEQWRNKAVQLSMERIPGISKVWLNGVSSGECQAFAIPHVYDLMTSAVPGKYRLTVMINNEVTLEVYQSHHITPGSGSRYNGIIGRIELLAENRIAINSMQVYPDIQDKKAVVHIVVKNKTKEPCNGLISLNVRRKGEAGSIISTQKVEFTLPDTLQTVKTEISIPKPVLWDEFTPALYELEAELTIAGQNADRKIAVFGMRELTTKGSQFQLNGQPLFLRGTHDGGQFPLHAEPAMDKETWMHVLKVYKDYGLNHVRFHTWCPPEAAFQAADELGMLFQVEPVSPPYLELQTLLDTYGNHPSFGLVSLTNEMKHTDFTRKTISDAKNRDPRHLYCCTSHPWHEGCTDDYFVAAIAVGGKRNVGIQWGGGDVVSTTRFNTHAPETASDYRDVIEGINAPMVSHEMGQWAAYPDLSEIPKYNGSLRNLNYERIKANLSEKGLLRQAPDFALASGQLSLLLYKEEIESTLRTPYYGGFQLLDLHDYQGQGVSIVGILNAFWESKGLTTPEIFREFCSSAVPLFRMSKRVWKQNETFEGIAELAYFGPVVKKDLQPHWQICDDKGNVLLSGKTLKTRIDERGLITLGKISASLKNLPTPAKLQLVIEIPEVKAKNRWDFWLYPEKINTDIPEDILVVTEWNDETEKALARGQKVLFFPKAENLPGSRTACFTTMFWNPFHKWHQAAHTLGILCDPSHPVFASFPTDYYSNWQWWDLTMHSQTMVLDKLPVRMKPLIQVVDNIVTNQKLGYLYECKIGNGKLMVCSIDISSELDSRPVAGQFRQSLLNYMNSETFNPEYELNIDLINRLFKS